MASSSNSDSTGSSDSSSDESNAAKETFACTMCSKTFSMKKYRNSHMKAHTNPFKCEICSKTFSQNSNVKRHMLTHVDRQKKFKCKSCSKTFARKDHLIEHEQIHSEEKILKCPHCPKTFTHNRNLIRHQSVHDDEKFSCEFCSKLFAQKSFLTAHVKRAHQDGKQVVEEAKPYTCSNCGKAYVHLRSLKRHESSHVEKIKCKFFPKKPQPNAGIESQSEEE